MDTKKNKSKNLENFKSLFFETGLVVSLFIVLAAFEWKTSPSVNSLLTETPYVYIDTDTVIKFKTIEKTPPPKVITEIKVTKKEVETTPEIFNTEWDNKASEKVFTEIKKDETEPQVEGDEIITVPPVMPQFPGGDEALMDYMMKNTKYPMQDREIGLQGKVYVSFVVEKSGEVSQVKLERGIGGQCDGEAMRVVKNMPSWVPGKNSLGRPVRVKLTLPVSFILIN